MSLEPNSLEQTPISGQSSTSRYDGAHRAEVSHASDPRDESVAGQELTRLSRMLWVLGFMLAVLVSPIVAGRIQYAMTEARERAQFDVAKENLQDISLTQFSTASRLLAQYVGPSVVSITTRSGRAEGEGSGVIVDEEGYIITNHHVVAGVRSAEIQLSDGRRGKASVVGTDPLVDVAVLKTNLDNLTAAEWGDSDRLSVGEMVWALGSPFGFEKSITFGILSAKERRGIGRQINGGNQPSIYQEFLQTDAAVNPGNSGGPLVNVSGEIVGINTAIIGPTYQGISFSIPSAIVRKSYDQLRKEGSVERGYLGVQPIKLPDRIANEMGLDKNAGVLVVHVEQHAPADEAGMVRGDVILSWNGEEFSDPTLMSRAIAATKIGSKVPVVIVRKGDSGMEQRTLTVQVAARPSFDSL